MISGLLSRASHFSFRGSRLARAAFSALALTAATALVSACAPTVVKPGPAVAHAHLTENAFITEDGLALPLRQWLPEGAPTAVVVAVHGFNDYSRAFDKVPGAPGVGPYLADHGIAVVAYDQRGFGNTTNRGFWAGGDALVDDFDAVVRAVKAEYPNVPLYAMGESMGGAVVMAALASREHLPFKAAILASPAVWARSTMPLVYRVALWFGAHFLPEAKPTGEGLGRQASDNIPMLRENGRDPLFIKETRVDAVYGLANLMDRALVASASLKVPVLYLYGRKDEIIPSAPAYKAMAMLKAGNRHVRTAIYANGWHMIMRDLEAPTVLADVAAYIADPAAPLPSGADLPGAVQPAGPPVQTAAKEQAGGY